MIKRFTLPITIPLIFKTIPLLLICPLIFGAEFERVSCVIHVHSNFSGGRTKTISQVISEAESNNVDALFLTDHDLMKWEYGIFSYSENSVLKAGPKKYLDEIQRVQSENPGIIIIPGVESAPFYYWTGTPLKHSLTLNSWHKHVIIAGLYNEDDYYNLPLMSNPSAGKFNVIKLWPLIVLTGGILLSKKRKYFFILAAIGAFLLFQGYPFRSFEYNQYSGTMGDEPYQKLIDYANSKGALTFLAHPEARNYQKPVKLGPIYASTLPYPESVYNISGLTGFGALSEGYNTAFNPGGNWDKALIEYCKGSRKKPLWGIGEIDYGERVCEIDEIKNIAWVVKKDAKSILESIRNGNFYSIWQQGKKGNFRLDDFSVSSGKSKAICGQEIEYSEPVRLAFTLASKDIKPCTAKITIIRNGETIKTIESSVPNRVIIEDTGPLPKGETYYRATIITSNSYYITLNPVFVKKG